MQWSFDVDLTAGSYEIFMKLSMSKNYTSKDYTVGIYSTEQVAIRDSEG